VADEPGAAPVTDFVPPPEPRSSGATAPAVPTAVPPASPVTPTPGEPPVAEAVPLEVAPDPEPEPEPVDPIPRPQDSVESIVEDEGPDPDSSESPYQAEVEGCRVIAVVNQKGGVGKSTTSVNLGAALAEAGKRVLVVDLDPQGNASTGMGIDHSQREVSTYQVLTAGVPAEDAIVDTATPNLSAIPSTIDLAGAEIELVSQFSREMRLSRALDPIKAAYDFVILDCPPSLGLLTVNALTASTELIVPIQCEYYALEGLGQLLRNVRLVQQNVNPRLRLSGIVLTMYDSRTKLAEQVVEEVRRYFGSRVYDTVIPRTVRLSEAPGYGQPITTYDPTSKGAQCYRALAGEVLERPLDDGLAPVPIGDEELPAVILPARTEEEEAPEADEVTPDTAPEPPAAELPAPAPAEVPPPAEPEPPEVPAPAEPEPAEPTPLEPAPAEPEPAEPAPLQPEPAQPVPLEPAPPEPEPQPEAIPDTQAEAAVAEATPPSSDDPATVVQFPPPETEGAEPSAASDAADAQERRRRRFLRWREGGEQ
jgi:chromosome partitioning protein